MAEYYSPVEIIQSEAKQLSDWLTSIMQPILHTAHDSRTGTWQYVLACPNTKHAAIIDPVLDFDPATFTVSTDSADSLLRLVSSEGYSVKYLLETHAHADHLSSSYYIQQSLLASGKPHAPICIGNKIRIVQNIFAQKYDIPAKELDTAFDRLFETDEEFNVGDVTVQVLHLPGHTPDHIGYLIKDEGVITGDSIFNPDVGSARCDFPGGDARALYKSMKTLLDLPPHYKIYTGHDYPPASADGQGKSREPMPCVTVAEQRERNKHAKEGSTEEEFVRWRSERDSGLNEPRLIHQALQVNARGGRMPKRTHNGKVFFEFLVNVPDRLMS